MNPPETQWRLELVHFCPTNMQNYYDAPKQVKKGRHDENQILL